MLNIMIVQGHREDGASDVSQDWYMIFKPDASLYIHKMNALRATGGCDFFAMRSLFDKEAKEMMLTRRKVRLYSHFSDKICLLMMV